MPRALVVFHAGHHETRLAAEEIALGISRAGRMVTVVSSFEELSTETVRASGLVVLGSPASAREAVREAHELAPMLASGALDRKTVSVFDAGLPALHGAGARKLRESLRESDPSLHLASPGISVVIDRSSGELPDEEVTRCRQFGEHLAGLAFAVGLA
jgi:flavorubredoxin